MATQDIETKIASFPAWHYEFDLGGSRTTISAEGGNRNRQEQRARYVFDPLTRAFAGSLAGKRVLDLGCNSGYFALQAIERSCDFVLGVDGRQMHVDQANFVFAEKGVESDRYRFIAGDATSEDLGQWGPFDIVLCLGLLYHVSDPGGLIERIAQLNTGALVVDTTLLPLPGRLLQLHREQPEDPRFAVREQFVAIPTRQAVTAMSRAAGYSVAALRPRFTSYEAAEDYRAGRRRAFLCAKDPRLLQRVGDDIENASAPRIAWTAARWGLHLAADAVRSRYRPG
jgi:SAM-dependent methyltransferase